MKKVIIGLLAIIILFVVGLVIFVNVSWKKTYDQELPSLTASTDSAVIARGRHLVYGAAHCAHCHMPFEKLMEVEKTGSEPPLSGGWGLEIPPGIMRAPNLTPDEETGIGSYSDGQLARAMRFSIAHDGMPLMPFMPFQDMSNQDMLAIISYLRSQPAVKNEVPRSEFTFLGKALLAFGAIKPEGPSGPTIEEIKPDSTIAYGKYLANSVGNCVGCHTERDLKSGAFIGESFAGGMVFEPDNFTEGYAFISPNLTPHQGTGIITSWDEAQFINRMKSGRVYAGSPMPWGAFAKLDTVELKAIYRYLNSLDPIEREVAQVMFEPGEELPQ